MFTKSDKKLVCDECTADEEADQEAIIDYVSQHPDTTPDSVAAAIDVDVDCVLRVIDEGRVAQVNPDREVRCGRCGRPAISLSKKLCESCLAKLNQEIARQTSAIRIPAKSWKGGDGGSVSDTVKDKSRG